MRRLIAVAGVLAASTLFVPTPAHAGGGCHSSGDSSGAGTTVELAMNCMNPRVLRAPAGSSVTFVNHDETTHNLFGGDWGVDELRAGKTYVKEFTVGTHVYACTLHPGMVGAIVVGDGVGTPIADVTPVRKVAASSSASDDDTSDRLPLGLVVGALVGSVATLGVRRLQLGEETHVRGR